MVINSQSFSYKSSQTGFTLIEIAIVLVIVGLLLGGVLKGQGFIHNQRVQSLIRIADEYSVAIDNYRSLYHALPGDDSNAADHFDGVDNDSNGNGNGELDSTDERRQLFVHLAAADMIKGFEGIGESFPTHVLGGQIRILTGMDGLGLAIVFTNVSRNDAEEIDRRVDGIVSGTQGVVRNCDTSSGSSSAWSDGLDNNVCIRL